MPRAATTMANLLLFLVALSAGAASQQAPAPAPAAGGCTAVLAKLADCLHYATAGSPLSQPPESCCTEVDSGVKDPAAVGCVCHVLGGHTFGLPLNLTRAAGLPSACGAPADALSKCDAPSPSPAAPTAGGTGSSSKSEATRSPITAVVLVATVAAPLLCYYL